ncbi:MAG: 3-isopropylmalate dehydratase small subunit [Proteobacteria bacterium]|nr:3-isopropylmalate dehydratase small subunit [Pseudomonadota bacterium]MDA1326860.1 3-isopropylmalate dehydratase small subunit [Pseudomonadota bacterium]
MEPFRRFTAIAAPMDRDNIDTDQIIPARYLMMPRDERYKTYVFRDLRIDPEGREIEGFILNQPAFRDAKIIVARHNFGCGSSREGAVFTLRDAGFRSIIATSFGDIFYNNSFNNGVLPVVLPAEIIDDLHAQLAENPGAEITVDLEAQTVIDPNGTAHPFDIDPHRRHRLLNGLDAVGYTLQFKNDIEEFEAEYQKQVSWH